MAVRVHRHERLRTCAREHWCADETMPFRPHHVMNRTERSLMAACALGGRGCFGADATRKAFVRWLHGTTVAGEQLRLCRRR